MDTVLVVGVLAMVLILAVGGLLCYLHYVNYQRKNKKGKRK